MLANVKLLLEENHFLVLNTYSLGFSSIILDNLLDEHFSKNIKRQTGEIFLQSTAGARLPLGVFARHCTV